MGSLRDTLIPAPKRITDREGTVTRFHRLQVRTNGCSYDVRDAVGKYGITVTEGSKDDPDSFTLVIQHISADQAAGIPPGTEGTGAYNLEILPETAILRIDSDQGFRNGLATFLHLVKVLQKGGEIRSTVIEDWPDMRYRGIFIEDKWGPDLMNLEDWKHIVDFLSAYKVNVLGVGLYGCWCVQYRGQVTEFLMVPVPDHPELKTGKRLHWYSAVDRCWKSLEYLPIIFEKDFFGDLVSYGQVKGVHIIPFVNSLGHNTLFPRLIPEVSARDAGGRPTGYGYCLSNPATWEFITAFYGGIIDRYLRSSGSEFFHIQMDEIYPVVGADPSDPRKQVDPDCKCPECQKRSKGERIQKYIADLVEFLCSRGVKTVVIWNDQLTRHMDLLDNTFLEDLKTRGIFEKVVLHWWWYDNGSIHERVHPNLGDGLRSWVGPMTCYYNWSYYRNNHPNITNMLEMGHDEGSEGAVSYSTYDPSSNFDFALLADASWNAGSDVESVMERFSRAACHEHDGEFREAMQALDRASDCTSVKQVVYYTYTYPKSELPYPRKYPLEGLQVLEKEDGSSKDLRAMHHSAGRARELFDGLFDDEPPDNSRDDTVGNLRAEALRFEMLSKVFLHLLEVREALRKPQTPEAVLSLSEEVRDLSEQLLESLAVIESGKPEYMVPSVLRDLSVLYEFLQQLQIDLAELAENRREVNDVRWHVDPCCAQV